MSHGTQAAPAARNTTATLDKVPNPEAAAALGDFLGKLRTSLIAGGFTQAEAFEIARANATYVIQNSTITIVSEVGA